MKGTELFKAAIQNYLEYRAMTDDLFAPRYANPAKNIDDCITYILNEVQKSGMNGFDDDEIYSMAMHYYDEDDIEIMLNLLKRKSRTRAKRLLSNISKWNSISYRAEQNRNHLQLRQPMFNPHYLIFDYEAENTYPV